MSQKLSIMLHAKISTFFLLVFVGFFKSYAQPGFDEKQGTQNWPAFYDAPNALYHHLAEQATIYLNKRSFEISTYKKLADWEKRQQWLRQALADVVAPFPQKTPLNAKVTNIVDKDVFHVEHIIFESQPKYYVTSSLFVPYTRKSKEKLPAIIFCSGHSATGYRTWGYQQSILNLVKKGFVVLAFDPVGQGERLQYIDTNTRKPLFSSPTHEHSYPGAQLFITGNSLAKNFVWDGIRAIDYLLTRKEVDPKRIGITGRSGGGTQSAYIAAFDDRIKAVSVDNYLTNFSRLFQAMGPQDAEQNFINGIQRGLDMADLLLVRAPKPAQMVTTSRDIFPIQGAMETRDEVKRIYNAYGQPENFNMVIDDTTHASTKKNRESMYAFFQKHLNNPGDATEEDVQHLLNEELQVTSTGQVVTSLHSETAFSLNYKEAEKKMQALIEMRKNKERDISGLIKSAIELSGYKDPAEKPVSWFVGRIQRDSYAIEKYLLKGEGNYWIPYIKMLPNIPTDKAILYLNPEGKSADAQVGGEMEWFTKNGIIVIAPDLIGMGELGPGNFKGDSYIDSVSYNIWFAGILIKRSIVGIQASDLARIVCQLKVEGVKEVYGLAKKQLSPVLIHAAAFQKDIKKIALIEPFSSYYSIVRTVDYKSKFLHNCVAGSIGVYDLPDLLASLAPNSLLIAGVTDGKASSNNPQAEEDIKIIEDAYKNMKSSKLQIVSLKSISEILDNLSIWLEN